MTDTHRSYLAGGHVYCTMRRADLDIDECFGCPSLKELNDRVSPPYIVCERIEPAGIRDVDRSYLEWLYQHHRRMRAV
ncbi:MAG TPA: hypothetical protein VI056_11815 [Candidatus Limnocylindria bacterium]